MKDKKKKPLKLVDKILKKILLRNDREIIEKKKGFYLCRTYAGRWQREAWDWSFELKCESDIIFNARSYDTATELSRYKLIVIGREGGRQNNKVLIGVNSCSHCPHYQRKNSVCFLNDEERKGCPFATLGIRS